MDPAHHVRERGNAENASVSSDRRAQDKEERLAGPHTFIGRLKKMRGKPSLLFGVSSSA